MTAIEEPTGAASARHAAEPSIGELVAEASTSFSTLIRGEIDLARLEVTASLKKGGLSIAAFLVAGAMAIFALIFLFVAVAAVLARYLMPTWVAFLAVFGLLLVIAAVLALIGVRLVKRVKAPERTIATTKDTVSYLKASAKRG